MLLKMSLVFVYYCPGIGLSWVRQYSLSWVRQYSLTWVRMFQLGRAKLFI